MRYLEVNTPLKELTQRKGIYGGHSEEKPAYTLRHLNDISIVRVVAFSHKDQEQIAKQLKSLLGLVIPEQGKSFISGTRKILREDERTILIVTEGEARGVLFSRVYNSLVNLAAVFEMTAAMSILRLDGYNAFSTLAPLLSSLDNLPQQFGMNRKIKIDNEDIIFHYVDIDILFLYIPRNIVKELYSRIARLCLPYGLKII